MIDIASNTADPEGSDRDSSASQPPTKLRKTRDGPKHRRAAHACDQCRNQKLRCQPSSESIESRCQRCLKWDLKCEFTTARNTEKATSVDKEGAETSKPFVKRGPILSRDARIAKLEELVGALIREDSHDSISVTASASNNIERARAPSASIILQSDQTSNTSFQQSGVGSLGQGHAQTIDGGNNDISYNSQPNLTAVQQNPLYASVNPFQAQTFPSCGPYGTSATAANTTLAQAFTFQNTPSDASSILPANQISGFGVPPLASTSQASEGSAKSPPTRSRPIPRVAAAYRMATLADPSSHEAPFRPLTYHPDTFKNTEMSRPASPEPGTLSNGKRTPKSGKGDAIELGIFTEGHARALFAL